MSEHHPQCGLPATSIAGRVPNGFVRVQIAGATAPTWFCGVSCAVEALTGDAPTLRADVAVCPACITRHDIGHVCRSCGHVATVSGYRWRAGRPA